jgi:signal transduction histidine kinase/HAMP domain-containing protein
MRWWLAGVFGLIAALTALLVATVSSRQVTADVRTNSEDIAVGKTVAAAFAAQRALDRGNLEDALALIARRQHLAVFVFSHDGHLLSDAKSLGVFWTSVPDGPTALGSALSGHRFVETFGDGAETVVALPLRGNGGPRGLVAYAPRETAFGKSLAIFHREVIRASLWALLAAIVLGLLAATLVARRLKRIADAAAAIEQGDFAIRLEPRLRDEVGSLALSIDRMRVRLRDSFERLRAERDRLGLLLEQLQEGVLAVDADLNVQFANASAARMLGPALQRGGPLADSWHGLPLRGIARGLFRPDAAVAEARSGGDEDRAIISLAGVPASNAGLAVLVLTDITARARRERAEREFVANASHELRTPVTAIASAVEALQSGAQDSPPDRDAFIALIGRQARRLGRLTHSLLVMARAQTGEEPIQLEPVDLRPVLDDVAAASEPPAAVRLDVSCPSPLVALAQRDLVEQIVANLVGNALKHTERGSVELRARPVGEQVVLEVADTGPGIPPGEEDRVFDRFYSGHNGRRDGFGLGLAIARDAVRSLGGRIEIESEAGSGTTARVTLARGRGS